MFLPVWMRFIKAAEIALKMRNAMVDSIWHDQVNKRNAVSILAIVFRFIRPTEFPEWQRKTKQCTTEKPQMNNQNNKVKKDYRRLRCARLMFHHVKWQFSMHSMLKLMLISSLVCMVAWVCNACVSSFLCALVCHQHGECVHVCVYVIVF